MSDQLDNATELEQMHRDAALKAAQQRLPEPPQEHDEHGTVICRECGDAILPARLAIQPTTPWCTECKQLVGTHAG